MLLELKMRLLRPILQLLKNLLLMFYGKLLKLRRLPNFKGRAWKLDFAAPHACIFADYLQGFKFWRKKPFLKVKLLILTSFYQFKTL